MTCYGSGLGHFFGTDSDGKKHLFHGGEIIEAVEPSTLKTEVTLKNGKIVKMNMALSDLHKELRTLWLEQIAMARGIEPAYIDLSAANNVSSGETDLLKYSLPANTLAYNGRAVRVTAWGDTANNANGKTVKLYFGSQVILTTALTASQLSPWKIDAVIGKDAPDSQKSIARLSQGGTTQITDVELASPAIVETTPITIKCTGQGTATSDIVQRGLLIERLG